MNNMKNVTEYPKPASILERINSDARRNLSSAQEVADRLEDLLFRLTGEKIPTEGSIPPDCEFSTEGLLGGLGLVASQTDVVLHRVLYLLARLEALFHHAS